MSDTPEVQSDFIRQRMERDMRRTLHATGMVSDFMEFGTFENLVTELVNDGMFHVEKVLADAEMERARRSKDAEVGRIARERDTRQGYPW